MVFREFVAVMVVGQAVYFFADKLDEWKFAGVLDL